MKLGLSPCYVKIIGMSNLPSKKYAHLHGNGIENTGTTLFRRITWKKIVDRGFRHRRI